MLAAVRVALLTHLLGALFIIHAHATTEHNIPIEVKSWDTGKTPLSHMVDVTNQFGLKVLAEHNFMNENNIAFSPYGLMGILLALYEGVEGASSYQIQRAMQLPWNRNVMRIGFRDIHRTLKTYFVPEEGFLAGLALNNENVIFNESYRKILRFYGFDLEDKLPSIPVNNGTSEISISPIGYNTTTAATASAQSTARDTLSTDIDKEETTSNPNAEIFNDIDVRMPTTNSFSVPTDETTTSISATTLVAADTTVERVRGTMFPAETTTTDTDTVLTQSTVTDTPTITIMDSAEKIISSNSFPTPSATTTAENEETVLISERESTDATFITTSSGTSQTTSEDINMGKGTTTSPVPRTETAKQYITTRDRTLPTDIVTQENGELTIEPIERQKKSIVNFIFTNPPYTNGGILYKAFDVPIPMSNIQINRLEGDHKMFLANGLKTVQVLYMQYDSILEHAYLPHLEAEALRLPLDSERYYLLAVLPVRAHAAELVRLLDRLARRSNLRDIYAALRPRRVKALLPSFTVKGHVTLIGDLQKLGIRDVFEPRQSDYAPMTPQPGVFVRSIEQAVSVAIRRYGPDDRNSSKYTHQQPIHFSARYPFLYFVMDASIHVALMAGKMVDPLNSRIL